LEVVRWFLSGQQAERDQTRIADTFEEARAKFEPAWLAFANSRKPADFAERRDHQEWTRRKYALRDAGRPTPIREKTE
jgi:hypothetical protein